MRRAAAVGIWQSICQGRRLSRIGVKLVHPLARVPEKATGESAGYDLFAVESVTVPPTCSTPDGNVEVGRALVPTGIILNLPAGTVGRIASRSGLSVRFNIEVGAGWVDSDYRGEILVEVKNLSSQAYEVSPADRIAQLIILPLAPGELEVVAEVEETTRGSRGFGSTDEE